VFSYTEGIGMKILEKMIGIGWTNWEKFFIILTGILFTLSIIVMIIKSV
jgi:uncharacterized ion transporter superfamily protein YfcC